MHVDLQYPGRRKALQSVSAVLMGSAWGWAYPLPALAQASATKVPAGVDFADLIRLLMPVGALQPLPWPKLDAWPLRWRSAAATRLARPQPGMGLLRLGELVLLIDGKPAYRTSDQSPGAWSLLAQGDESGVAEVSLGARELAAENSLSLSAL